MTTNTIEQNLERIATALEGLHTLAAGKAAAPATEKAEPFGPNRYKAKPEKAKPAARRATRTKKDPGPTLDDLRRSLGTVIREKGADVAKDILVKFDVEKLSDLKPEQYQDVQAAAAAASE